MSRNPEKIQYLELLRFILSFFTIIWHYYYYGPLHGNIQLPAVVQFKYLSFTVDAFFIISGLVIMISATSRQAIDFARSRFVRLGPALLICSTFTLLVIAAGGHPLRFDNYLSGVTVTPLAVHSGIDSSMWSLKFEIRFYAIIALIAYFANISRHNISVAAAIVSIHIIGFVAVACGIRTFDVLMWSLFLGNYGSFFAIGMVLYDLLVLKSRSLVSLSVGLAAVFAAGIHSHFEIDRISDVLHLSRDDDLSGTLTGFAIAALITGLVIAFTRSTKFPSLSALFKILGGMSYPLYLIHQTAGYIIIGFLKDHIPSFGDPRPLVVLVMVILSYVIVRFGEAPLTALYRGVFLSVQRWFPAPAR